MLLILLIALSLIIIIYIFIYIIGAINRMRKMTKKKMDTKTTWLLFAILFVLNLVAGCTVWFGDGVIELIGLILYVIMFLTAIIVSFVFIRDSNWLPVLILGAQFIWMFWIIGPLFHGFVMFFYLRPVIFEVLFLSLIFSVIAFFVFGSGKSEKILGSLIVFGISIIALLIILGLFGSYWQCDIAENYDVSEIFELPEMDEDYLRVTPKVVAYRYMSDACQYPRHQPNFPSDLVMIDGKPYWSSLLTPDGIINKYNIKPVGSVYVDMTDMDKSLDIKEHSFKYAPGLAIKDDINFQIYLNKYFITVERALVIPYEDDVYIAKPYIEYEFKFTFPVWYTVPVWGGTFLVHEDGTIEDLSPEESRNHLVLQGQKLFPEELVDIYVDSQNYWKVNEGDSYFGALINVWISHENQIEITDVTNQGNEQPFLLNTVDGLKWTVSVEPYGSAHGVYKIYLIDARTGEMEFMKFTGEEIGPVRACDYARKDNPKVDWDRFRVIEPIPVIPNGNLFWEVAVTAYDGSGISYIAFVNPLTGEVTQCDNNAQVIDFIHSANYVQSNETVDNTIEGVISRIETYTYDGNTYWVIKFENSSNDPADSYIASALDLTTGDISILVLSEPNDYLKLEVYGNRVSDVIAI